MTRPRRRKNAEGLSGPARDLRPPAGAPPRPALAPGGRARRPDHPPPPDRGERPLPARRIRILRRDGPGSPSRPADAHSRRVVVGPARRRAEMPEPQTVGVQQRRGQGSEPGVHAVASVGGRTGDGVAHPGRRLPSQRARAPRPSGSHHGRLRPGGETGAPSHPGRTAPGPSPDHHRPGTTGTVRPARRGRPPGGTVVHLLSGHLRESPRGRTGPGPAHRTTRHPAASRSAAGLHRVLLSFETGPGSADRPRSGDVEDAPGGGAPQAQPAVGCHRSM